MSHFGTILDDFQTQLDEIDLCYYHLKYHREFRAVLFPIINWTGANDDQKKIINSYIGKNLPSGTMLNSLFNTLAACYENFLRKMLMLTIGAIDNKTKNYNDLSIRLRNKHYQSTGTLLANHASPPDYLKLDYKKLAENLATCYDGSMDFKLNPEISIFPKGLVSLNSFFEFLDLCEIKLSFESIAKNEIVRKYYGMSTTKERERILAGLHDQILRLRNSISHCGLENVDLSPQILETIFNTLRMLSTVLCNCVEQELDN